MGAVWTLLIGALLGIGGYTAARYGFRQARGSPRALATILLAWVWLTLGVEVLGGAGVLSRLALLAWAGAGIGVGFVRGKSESSANVPKTPDEPWSWVEMLTGGFVLWASTILGATSLLRPVKVVSDGPIYHLYFAARWWRSGSLEAIATPFGENGATYFPAVGDLWFTALMTSWGGDRLAKVGQVPFAVVGGLTIVALARRLGASRAAGVLAAAWFLTSSPLFIFTFEPNVDTIFAAGYLLSVYFFLRYDLGDDGRASLVLGALAGGCALGTKATSVVFVPPLLVWGGYLALRSEQGWSDKLRWLGMVAGLPWLVAGFWFVRNAWWTGNPLYPLHLEAFGHVWLRGWYGPNVMRLSQYYLPVDDWRSFIDILNLVLDPRLVPLWVASLLGVWRIGKRTATDSHVAVIAAAVVMNVALYWFLIPYRTQQRFMMHAIGLAALPLARTFERAALLRWLGLVLLGIHLCTGQSWPFDAARHNVPWDFSPGIPKATRSFIRLPTPSELTGDALTNLLIVGSTFGFGLASFGAVWCWIRLANAPRGPGVARRATVAIAQTFLLTALAVGLRYPWNDDERHAFFPPYPDYFRGWLALDRASGAAGTRVAYAGTDIPYYLMGAGLRNEVQYVNVDAHPGWLLHDYHRDALKNGSGPATWPYPRPGWDRAHPDYDAWLKNLHAAGIRLLVVTRADPANGLHNVADSDGFTIERQWADRHPEAFEPFYGVVESDPRLRIYRVRPAGDGPF